MALTVAEEAFMPAEGGAPTLSRLHLLPSSYLGRVQRVANRHRRDLLWNLNASRVAENVVITAALRCLPSHVTRRAGELRPGMHTPCNRRVAAV